MTSAMARIEKEMHPAHERALDIIEKDFVRIMMKGQNILSKKEQREKVLNLLPVGKDKELLEENWKMQTDEEDPAYSQNLWGLLKQVVNKPSKGQGIDTSQVDYLASVMFTYLYPRLDANVSKGINHLLKSPF